MNYGLLRVPALACLLLVNPAHAASTEKTAPLGSTVATMESLRSELAVLRARLDVAKTSTDIEAASKQATRVGSLPKVVSIYGVGSNVTAVLEMPDGTSRQVSIGDGLPGGYRVVSIDQSGVAVEKHRRRMVLTFAPYVPQYGGGGMQSQTPLPPMPMTRGMR